MCMGRQNGLVYRQTDVAHPEGCFKATAQIRKGENKIDCKIVCFPNIPLGTSVTYTLCVKKLTMTAESGR